MTTSSTVCLLGGRRKVSLIAIRLPTLIETIPASLRTRRCANDNTPLFASKLLHVRGADYGPLLVGAQYRHLGRLQAAEHLFSRVAVGVFGAYGYKRQLRMHGGNKPSARRRLRAVVPDF